MEQKTIKIDLSWKSIARVFTFALFVYCLFYFSEIILWVFLALVISFLFNPLIDALEAKKVSRAISAILIYGIFMGLIILFTLSFFPPLITELSSLASNFYVYANSFLSFLSEYGFNVPDFANLFSTFQEQITGIVKNTVSFAGSIMGQLFAFMTIFTLAIFLSIEKQFPVNFIKIFTITKETEERVLSTFEESKKQVVGYFNAKLLACVFIAIATFVFLSILGMKYSLLLSIFAGILNIVPIVGPIISCLLMVFFAAFDSWVKVLIVVVFSILIQQIESNIIVPVLTKKILGIPTVLVLLSVLIGAKIGGLLGAIFIIPVVGIIYDFIQKYFNRRKEKVRMLK
ncbi:MAG: AI-2E family transporter [Candidatus Pacebacteria bacterium]|nr:AI-2E family transporter [Candidatus Paceibacterota bacterium]